MKRFIGLLALAALAGCGSTGAASRFEQRKVVGLTSMQIGEYTIPALTIGEGPSVSTYQSRDVPSYLEFQGVAVTTNTTTALGIYSSEEHKTLQSRGKIGVYPTNVVEAVHTKP